MIAGTKGPHDIPFMGEKGGAVMATREGAGRGYWPAAFLRSSARSVYSQVKSGSSRPKWP
jgi:hypothetical protein